MGISDSQVRSNKSVEVVEVVDGVDETRVEERVHCTLSDWTGLTGTG